MYWERVELGMGEKKAVGRDWQKRRIQGNSGVGRVERRGDGQVERRGVSGAQISEGKEENGLKAEGEKKRVRGNSREVRAGCRGKVKEIEDLGGWE